MCVGLSKQQIFSVDAGECRLAFEDVGERDVAAFEVFPLIDDVDVLFALHVRGTEASLHVLLINLDQCLPV